MAAISPNQFVSLDDFCDDPFLGETTWYQRHETLLCILAALVLVLVILV